MGRREDKEHARRQRSGDESQHRNPQEPSRLRQRWRVVNAVRSGDTKPGEAGSTAASSAGDTGTTDLDDKAAGPQGVEDGLPKVDRDFGARSIARWRDV
jgi:hypothetical protein